MQLGSSLGNTGSAGVTRHQTLDIEDVRTGTSVHAIGSMVVSATFVCPVHPYAGEIARGSDEDLTGISLAQAVVSASFAYLQHAGSSEVQSTHARR